MNQRNKNNSSVLDAQNELVASSSSYLTGNDTPVIARYGNKGDGNKACFLTSRTVLV